MKKRLIFIFVLAFACVALLAACGSTSTEVVAAHAPEATPVPTPSPSPYVEQTFYETEETIIVNGNTVKGVLAGDDGETIYLPLGDAVKALESSLDSYEYPSGSTIRKDFTFTYNGKKYIFYPDTTSCTIDDAEVSFDDKTIAYNSQRSLYVPMQGFSDALGLQVILDESNDTWYCSPVTELNITPGVQVPVLCFYGVAESSTDNYSFELFMNEDVFASMLDKLLDNDYEPIFFEDLTHLEDYTKPVIIMFCTNANNVYSVAYPLLKSYMIKANVFVYPDEIGTSQSLTMSQLKEMYKSGYISLQGGGIVRDVEGAEISERRQQLEIQEAYLDVLRASGNAPIAFCYGNGVGYDEEQWNYAKEYFQLGVTSDDESIIYTTGTSDEAIPVFQFTRYNIPESVISRIDPTAATASSESSEGGWNIVYNDDGSYEVVEY